MKPKEDETSLDTKVKGQGGDSDQEMMNLENELYSLTHYADDEEELVAQMFATIKGSKLEAMMPPILKEIPLIDVQQLCLHELRGMSQRRILSIINGQEMSGSSSEDSDSEKKPNETNENEDPNVTVKIEGVSEDLLTGKDLSELENINESNLTTLDILELEMRAKLIKTMLEKQGDEGKGEEEETNDLIPNIKIKEEPVSPKSVHDEDKGSPNGSPESHRRSRYSRRKRKHRRRSDSRSYSSSRSSSRSSYSSKSRGRSRTPSRSRSRSRSHSRSMSYTPEIKKDGSESPKSKKMAKKKISKKEFEARMQKAKMNRRYRKRKESEEDSGEIAKTKQTANETEEPSENPPDQAEEKKIEPSEEKNTEQTEAGEEEPAEEGEVEEKEEGEIDSNEEDALSRSSRSYSRSYSDSYSSRTSRSRSYSRSPKRRKSRKSKKRRRRRRSRSRSLSDVPKIPNWKPKDSVVINNNVESSNSEQKLDTKPEPETLPNKEERQSISFSINKKSAIKKSSDPNEENLISTAIPDNTELDSNTEEGNDTNVSDAKVENEKPLQIESTESADVKPEVGAEISEDFYKGADQLSLSDEGVCEDEKDIEKIFDDNSLTETNSAYESSIAKIFLEKSKTTTPSKPRKKKTEVISVYEDESALSEVPVNVNSPFETNDIPKDDVEPAEEISQLSSLPEVGDDSTQDVLEPLPGVETEDSVESHNLDIIGYIDPAETQDNAFDEDIAAGGSSWSMRWLQSEKVQKVVSNSKMLSKVRKKIQAKGKGIVKEAPKAVIPKQTIVEAKPESPKLEIKLSQPKAASSASNVIGSIEEYEKLFGIKVKAPTSLPQPKPQTKSAPSQPVVALLDSDDDEDSEEEAIWSKIMKK